MQTSRPSSITGAKLKSAAPQKLEVLDSALPIWLSEEEGYRLDNNFFSPAAHFAQEQLAVLESSGLGRIMPLGALGARPRPGVSPSEDGLVPLVEGANIRPNCIYPRFSKYADPIDNGVQVGDLLVTKDGEPGSVALVTATLLAYVPTFVWGNHVYLIRLNEAYLPLSAYICAFLNSKTGQSLIRRTIAGGTTPTIRQCDLEQVVIYLPNDVTVISDASKQMEQLQVSVLEAVANLGPSQALSTALGLQDPTVRLPINWAGGGRSDPHNYDR